MLKVKSLAWCSALQHRLRREVEDAESGINISGMTMRLFGDPGGCDSLSALADRKYWAEALAELHELEEDLRTLDDEWWNGPKMDKKPTVGDTGHLGYMLACMRDGEPSVRRHQQDAVKRWELEQRNGHWNRRKEAETQRVDPNRKFRLRRG